MKFISLTAQVCCIGELPDIFLMLMIGELRKAPRATLNALLRTDISEFKIV